MVTRYTSRVMQSVHTGYADTVRDSPPFTGSVNTDWVADGKYRDENVVYHHGGYAGWSSHISYMPDKKIGVAVMINEALRRAYRTPAGDICIRQGLGTETTENYVKQLRTPLNSTAR